MKNQILYRLVWQNYDSSSVCCFLIFYWFLQESLSTLFSLYIRDAGFGEDTVDAGWLGRQGIALALHSAADVLRTKDLPVVMTFLISRALVRFALLFCFDLVIAWKKIAFYNLIINSVFCFSLRLKSYWWTWSCKSTIILDHSVQLRWRIVKK